MLAKDRYSIHGTLTVQTPLHIGCGATTQRDGLLGKEGPDLGRPVQVSAVATDYRGRPYLPGSTLKGRLRALLVEHPLCEELFGTEKQSTGARAGKVEFWDAALRDSSEVIQSPFGDASRRTYVQASVGLDRVTGAARQHLLMHREVVVPGASFDVELTGQGLSPQAVATLLGALDQLGRVGIGADVGDGMGQMRWELVEVRRLRQQELAAWLELADPPVGYAALARLSAEELAVLRQQAAPIPSAPAAGLTIPVRLQFTSPFLVLAPRQKDQPKPKDEPTPPAAVLDAQGAPLLPARSLRGALRSQAERIVRTLRPEASCRVTRQQESCSALYQAREADRLCLTCQLFGVAGWRARLEVPDFRCIERGEGMTQEFIAIDRFTGGGADGRKFILKSFYQPVLAGTLVLHPTAEWMMGLVGLVLRDLIEGDMTLGLGAARGYGTCVAELDDLIWQRLRQAVPSFHDYLQSWQPTKRGEHAAGA